MPNGKTNAKYVDIVDVIAKLMDEELPEPLPPEKKKKTRIGQRGKCKTEPEIVNARIRGIRALQLRQAGYRYDEIAKNLGYNGRAAAWKAANTVLKEAMEETTDDYRRMESAKLDALAKVLWVKALRGSLLDIDRLLKIMERKARLMGLDMPTKVEQTGLPSTVRIYNAAKEEKKK